MANIFTTAGQLAGINWKNAKTATAKLDPLLKEKLKECNNENFKLYCSYFETLLEKEKNRRGLV